MQFNPVVGNVWSVRIGDHYRAVAQKHGDLVVWFWTGTHEEYNKSSYAKTSSSGQESLDMRHLVKSSDERF
jgi:hypothetical protein